MQVEEEVNREMTPTPIYVYIFQWIGSLIVISLLNIFALWLLQKKFNEITTAILAFIFVSLLVFLTAPFILSFERPAVVYLPMLIIWLIINLIWANKKS